MSALQDDPEAAVIHLREAVRRYEELEFWPMELARALDNLAIAENATGDVETAREHLERALELKEAVLPREDGEIAPTRQNLSAVTGGRTSEEGPLDSVSERVGQ